MGKIDTLIAKAKSYVGVSESPSGSNNVIFNTDYYGKAINGSDYSWCVTYLWDIFRMCGYSQYFYGGGKTASCTELLKYYKTNFPEKVIYKNFQKGELALYNFNSDPLPDHIGLISQVNSTTVNSIEGNTGNLSQDNGGKVMEKVRNKSLIICSIHWWDDEKTDDQSKKENTKVTIELNQLSKGSSGKSVENLQVLLNAKGFDCGKVDGSFGDKTFTAVKQFQSKNNLLADGVVGAKTWDKLLNG